MHTKDKNCFGTGGTIDELRPEGAFFKKEAL